MDLDEGKRDSRFKKWEDSLGWSLPKLLYFLFLESGMVFFYRLGQLRYPITPTHTFLDFGRMKGAFLDNSSERAGMRESKGVGWVDH